MHLVCLAIHLSSLTFLVSLLYVQCSCRTCTPRYKVFSTSCASPKTYEIASQCIKFKYVRDLYLQYLSQLALFILAKVDKNHLVYELYQMRCTKIHWSRPSRYDESFERLDFEGCTTCKTLRQTCEFQYGNLDHTKVRECGAKKEGTNHIFIVLFS